MTDICSRFRALQFATLFFQRLTLFIHVFRHHPTAPYSPLFLRARRMYFQSHTLCVTRSHRSCFYIFSDNGFLIAAANNNTQTLLPRPGFTDVRNARTIW
jgi:hypothetical protein